MVAPWDPPGFVFHPAEATIRPTDPDLPEQVLASVQWDGDAMAMLMGKTVVIGVTFHNRDGDEFGRTQFGGTIVAATAEDGVTVRSPDGEERQVPPWPGNFRSAPCGTYRPRQGRIEMTDPDLLCYWELHEVPQKN